MKVFLICSVRNASNELLDDQLAYVQQLEAEGHKVHYPPRDTDQSQAGFDICLCNARAIEAADEVHVYFNENSQGTLFDMGVAFGLHKPVRSVYPLNPGPGKSFARMLQEWEYKSILAKDKR